MEGGGLPVEAGREDDLEVGDDAALRQRVDDHPRGRHACPVVRVSCRFVAQSWRVSCVTQ